MDLHLTEEELQILQLACYHTLNDEKFYKTEEEIKTLESIIDRLF